MSRTIMDFLQHHRPAALGQSIFMVIDGASRIGHRAERVASLVEATLMTLEATVGIEEGLQAGLKAHRDYKAQEADHFKATRDYIAEEIVK